MTAKSPHDYVVFGLRVRSVFKLPELFQAFDEGEPDVWVDEGAIDVEQCPSGLIVTAEGLLLTVPEVGRFLITGGRAIRVEAAFKPNHRNIRLFLLGSAFGALLLQRGLLPLHANAVEVAGRAFAFMGPSGAGKSTLAAWFHDCGHGIVADDVCVVDFDDRGRSLARPGLPRLRLWLDAIEASGRKVEGLSRSYVGGSAGLDKFDVPIDRSAMVHATVAIGAIYLLDQAPEFGLDRLVGVEAAEAIFANTYRGAYVGKAGTKLSHWQSALRLAANTPVFRARRTMTQDCFQREAKALLDHALSLSEGADGRD